MTIAIIDTEKKCPKCEQIKSIDLFTKCKSSPSGIHYWCRECNSRSARASHKRRMIEVPEYRLSKKSQHLMTMYGLTLEEYTNKLQIQKECAICSLSLVEGISHLDHDHKSGRVREFLCRHCNWGLGDFKDNKELLRKAIAYLEQHTEYGIQKEGTSQ